MAEIDISEEAVAERVGELRKVAGATGPNYAQEIAYRSADMLDTLRAALTAAEAERDEALGMAAALRECIGAAIECGMVPKSTAKNGGAASYAHQTHVADMLRSALTDTTEAAREYRARVFEEAAELAGLNAWKHVGDDAYSQGMDAGAKHQCEVIVKSLRDRAAKIREGRE